MAELPEGAASSPDGLRKERGMRNRPAVSVPEDKSHATHRNEGQTMNPRGIFARVKLFAILFGFWLIVSARFDFPSMAVGVLVAGLVFRYNIDLLFAENELPRASWRLVGDLFRLASIFIREVVFANIEVAKIVLSPKIRIEPTVATVRMPLEGNLLRALYGNAITLTPGTLTLELDEDRVLVHGLTPEHVEEIENGRMERAFMALEAKRS
jgi:multicomponent Na+:H+ antiporter subunit E